MKAVIALGANLGEPRKQLSSAIDSIREVIRVDAVSSFLETKPVGVTDEQPNYLNSVIIGASDLKPLDLMRSLLAIETELGRVRTFVNAARTIDIDLIEYGGYFMSSKELTLPHPRAHERRFVLEPWLEIDPDGFLAGRGLIAEILSQLK